MALVVLCCENGSYWRLFSRLLLSSHRPPPAASNLSLSFELTFIPLLSVSAAVLAVPAVLGWCSLAATAMSQPIPSFSPSSSSSSSPAAQRAAAAAAEGLSSATRARQRKPRTPELSVLYNSNCPAIARALVRSGNRINAQQSMPDAVPSSCPLPVLCCALSLRFLCHSLITSSLLRLHLCRLNRVRMLELSHNAEWVDECFALLGLEQDNDLQLVVNEITTILQRQSHSQTPCFEATQPLGRGCRH